MSMLNRHRLPYATRSPADARAFVGATLERAQIPHDVIANAQLLVSELVTNVLRHTTGDSLGVSVTLDPLVVSVSDSSTLAPAPQEPGVNEPAGRGLQLLHQLAIRWGYSRNAQGKTVWFELAPTVLGR